MAEEDALVIELNDGFYRDGFKKVIILLSLLGAAICLLISASVYLIVTKPPPQFFIVGEDFRLQPEVPVNTAYLTTPQVLQWTSDTLREIFALDFLDYNEKLAENRTYFTAEGWRVYQNQLNNYVDYNTVKSSMLFAEATPASAPFVLNQGLLSGRYAWWVQMPIQIAFKGVRAKSDENLTLQVLVVRVPTKDNLAGIAIENIIVETGSSSTGRQ